MACHSQCGRSKQVLQREGSQGSFKYYAIQIVLWVHRRWFRSFKGYWVFEEMEHGNITSNQVILYQEIQFPGMDVVFFPHTLPVYPHPASQRFLFLIHFPLPCQRPPCPLWRSASLKSLSQPSVTDVLAGTSPIDTSGSHIHQTACHWRERVTNIWFASCVQWYKIYLWHQGKRNRHCVRSKEARF